MSADVNILGETWLTCKEYIAPKDRQAAADHMISVVADHTITERDLKALGGFDAYLGRAVKEYLGDDDQEPIYDEENEDDDY